MKIIYVIFLFVFLVIQGCNSETEIKSVTYYVSHPDEAEQQIKMCSETGGQQCANARDAMRKIFLAKQEEKRIKRLENRKSNNTQLNTSGF